MNKQYGLIGKCIIEDGRKLQGWMSNTKERGWMGSRWMTIIYIK